MNEIEVEPADNMLISSNTVFKKGIYYLPNGIKIISSNIVMDFNGAIFIGNNFTNTGIYLANITNITI